MSSIRSRNQNLPGQSQSEYQLPGAQQNQNQRFYGPILAHGAINAMLTIQHSLAAACSVPPGVMPMNKNEWASVKRLAECGGSLADARKKCGAGGWSRAQQSWNAVNNESQPASAAAKAGNESQPASEENAPYQDQAGSHPYRERTSGFVASGSR